MCIPWKSACVWHLENLRLLRQVEIFNELLLKASFEPNEKMWCLYGIAKWLWFVVDEICKSKTYTQNKQPSDKTQSSKFCQLDVKRIHFQNRKKKRKWFFDHSTTLSIFVYYIRRRRALPSLLYLSSPPGIKRS